MEGRHVKGVKNGVGDRVFAVYEIQAPHGSYAEYAVAWALTTASLPLSVSFEGTQLQSHSDSDSGIGLLHDRTYSVTSEAVSIPLAALTASLALYIGLSDSHSHGLLLMYLSVSRC